MENDKMCHCGGLCIVMRREKDKPPIFVCIECRDIYTAKDYDKNVAKFVKHPAPERKSSKPPSVMYG